LSELMRDERQKSFNLRIDWFIPIMVVVTLHTSATVSDLCTTTKKIAGSHFISHNSHHFIYVNIVTNLKSRHLKFKETN